MWTRRRYRGFSGFWSGDEPGAERSAGLARDRSDGTGLVMIYKRLEKQGFAWPAVCDGTMHLDHAQFEALFAGLDWRRVRALSVRPPAEAE